MDLLTLIAQNVDTRDFKKRTVMIDDSDIYPDEMNKGGQNAYPDDTGVGGTTVRETNATTKKPPEKIVAVDYHGTIVNEGKVVEDVKKKMLEFKTQGFKIIIYSAGFNNNPTTVKGIEAFLRENGIPFDEVWQRNGKPNADVYIDDKSFNPVKEDINTLQVTPEGEIKQDRLNIGDK